MRRTRLLGLGLAAGTAIVAGAWVLESRTRHAVEQDRAESASGRPRRATRARAKGKSIAVEPAAATAPQPAAADPVRNPTGTRVGTPVEDVREANGEVARLPANLSSPDDLVAAWTRATGECEGEALDRAWNELVAALDRMVQAEPSWTATRVEQILREQSPAGRLRHGLFEGLACAAPDRAAALVRETQVRADPEDRRFAAQHLTVLPEREVLESWDRLLHDSDPQVREEAAGYLPGEGPQFAEVLHRAAADEDDPGRRGEMLAMAFESYPEADRLPGLLAELDGNRNPRFRKAIVTGISGHLDLGDRGTIDRLAGIALDPTEDAGVRDAAFEAILEPDTPLLARYERQRLEQAYAKLWQEQAK